MKLEIKGTLIEVGHNEGRPGISAAIRTTEDQNISIFGLTVEQVRILGRAFLDEVTITIEGITP